MTMTVLFDLDDTLLMNSMDVFLPAYLKALSAHLQDRFPGSMLIQQLMAATHLMMANKNPGQTLESTFDGAFYPALGVTKEEMRPAIESFYREVFPSLRELTEQRPEAIKLVNEAVRRGYQVVVATNPLFPRTAIHQRLAWAGLPPSEIPFSLITSYEDFHFAKPLPSFYAEIIAQLGWPPGQIVMVGNSLEEDIRPASQLNLPTYWVDGTEIKTGNHSLSSQGELSGVLDWLDAVAAAEPVPVNSTPAAVMAVLRSTPAALHTLEKSLTPEDWNRCDKVNEWNLVEIVCHLRDVDQEVNWPRMQRICEDENPFLPGINSDPWAEERNYAAQNGPLALNDFIKVRTSLLHLLDTFTTQECWQRLARHAIFGPTTMSELVSFIATHDRTHIQQVHQNLPQPVKRTYPN